ncbi:MAG: shikimate kinase [Ruminococcus sp.]|nr:shikimate kinase [Ruminococcus sp.]
MTIFLCGFMGCGKTTVGELLAKKLGLPLIDTDAYIVREESKTIPEIFAQDGEAYFREKEAAAIRTLCDKQAVISCGGGVMLNPESAAYARKNGIVVLLDESFACCYQRIRGDSNRPIVQRSTKEELEALFQQRASIYRVHASCVIPGGGTPKEMAKRIAKAVKTAEQSAQ